MFLRTFSWIPALVLASVIGAAATAEPLDYFLVPGVEYDQSMPKPAETFGHDIGDQPIRHDLMVAYIRDLVAKSPRMKIETIGYSHEHRPILFITVSSPENLARLDAIQANHLKRSNPATADEASDSLPVVTWLNYGVHGAEASGMDAVVPALYHLAAAKDAETLKILDESVLLITAVFNPDGHARRAAWVTSYGSDVRALDPAHEIHNQAFPGARTNHYWFDLNRQWLLQTQPESQAWLKLWHDWKPEVSADFHEMGTDSSYYFHPGAPTRKHPLIPAEGRALLDEMAGFHRDALDKAGTLYFSEEGFDNYYVGKGSTYPQVNGSVGILFEAGGQMGIAKESEQGVKTYAANILKHFRTSLSTMRGAMSLRPKLHSYQKRFYEDVAGLAKADPVKAYVFQAPEDPARVNQFLDLLARHRIEVHKVAGSVKAGDRMFESDAYLVPLDQLQYRMAKAIFGRITEFPDKVFYDVSGWTLPAAYGLDWAEVSTGLRGKLGNIVTKAEQMAVRAPDEAPYAYIFRWSDYYAPRALNRLLEAGILARVAKSPIDVQTTRGTRHFDRGAVIIQRDLQTVAFSEIHALMTQISEEDGLEIHAATSGHTLNVGADLGGRSSVADVKAVKPLLVIGQGVAVSDAGEVWHLLDHKMKMPLTLVNKDRLSRIDLGRYSHIILVGGRGSQLPEKMDDDLKAWVKAGGTLVATRQGAEWAYKTLLATDSKKKTGDAKEATPDRLSYADKDQKDAEHIIGGAVFESDLDISHPLGFGFVRRNVATHKNTTAKLAVPKDPYGQVAVYRDVPLVSGYASERRITELKGSPMMTAERLGDGAVILFADDPLFRATYLGSEKLFLNALFLSGAFDRAESDEAGAAAEASQE